MVVQVAVMVEREVAGERAVVTVECEEAGERAEARVAEAAEGVA